MGVTLKPLPGCAVNNHECDNHLRDAAQGMLEYLPTEVVYPVYRWLWLRQSTWVSHMISGATMWQSHDKQIQENVQTWTCNIIVCIHSPVNDKQTEYVPTLIPAYLQLFIYDIF